MYDDESGGSDTPEASASVVSGAWDMLSSAADAVVDTATAAAYASGAATEAVLGGAAHIDAGILDAVGADGLASEIREGANVLQDKASEDLSTAGDSLSAASDDVFGQ
jgi:hypothetical protein